MRRKHWLMLIVVVAGVFACQKNIADQFSGFISPYHFPEPAYHFATNEVTKNGFELGRKLFFDPILSANNTISCGSCHIPTASFTHHGHSVSHGIFDRLGTRNSPPIMNLAWNTSFMWDGGVMDLDLQPIAPITNHVEMADTLDRVLEKLRSSAVYRSMFKGAFGSEEISSAQFLKALSQFMVMCVSDQSRYDSVKRNQASFTAAEEEGYVLFKDKCGSCHKEPLFTDQSFRNNGLSISAVNDEGRFAVTLNEKDKYIFKVPTLRNLDFTPPYMHDGRLLSLAGVLDHYTGQVQPTLNLDPLLQKDGRRGIAMTPDEKTKILIFLKTLNDRNFILDKRFAEQ